MTIITAGLAAVTDADGICQSQTPAADQDGFAASQTPVAAGNLTLNGALTSGGAYSGLGRIVTITSAADDSGRTFTVTGTARDGSTSEDITGANAGTATGTQFWTSITSIAVDAATAGAVQAGTNGGKELILNGALTSAAVFGPKDYGVTLTITGGSNESGRSLVVYGTATDGSTSETITGPNATTVNSGKKWNQVDDITVDAATAGAITVGTLVTAAETVPVTINTSSSLHRVCYGGDFGSGTATPYIYDTEITEWIPIGDGQTSAIAKNYEIQCPFSFKIILSGASAPDFTASLTPINKSR